MRRAVVALLVVLTVGVSSALVSANSSAATLLGQLVDAGGRGETGQSVELVRDGVVITTTVTTGNGEFIFGGVDPGTYIVRTTMNNRAAGAKVSVNAGESRPITIVLPSLATASPQVGSAIGLLSSFMTSTAAVLSGPIFTNVNQNNDLGYIESVTPLQYLNFIAGIQDQIQGIADNIARSIRIGPYSTS